MNSQPFSRHPSESPNVVALSERNLIAYWSLKPPNDHATWSRVGHPPEIPVTGQRKSVEIFGAIEMWKTRFHYQRDSVFNAETYLAFRQSLARRYRRQGAILIHDNAS